MPFKSKAQARGAFSGAFGPEMKAKAAKWEDETSGGIKALPERVPGSGNARYHLSQPRKAAAQRRGSR